MWVSLLFKTSSKKSKIQKVPKFLFLLGYFFDCRVCDYFFVEIYLPLFSYYHIQPGVPNSQNGSHYGIWGKLNKK